MKVNRFAAGMLAAGILLTALGGCAEDAPENPPASPSTSISVSPTQMPSEPGYTAGSNRSSVCHEKDLCRAGADHNHGVRRAGGRQWDL